MQISRIVKMLWVLAIILAFLLLHLLYRSLISETKPKDAVETGDSSPLSTAERQHFPQSLQQAVIQVRQKSDNRRSAISKFYANLLDGNSKELQNRFIPLSLLHKLPPLHAPCAPNSLKRVGGSGDGGKWFCEDYFPKNQTDCVIFSLGSRGDFSFERAMSEYTQKQCKIFTFDCTGTWSSQHSTFYPWCLGPRDETQEGKPTFKKWTTILKELKISRVDYLKMDISGYEWAVLPELLHQSKELLPQQIAFEIHFYPPRLFQQPPDTPTQFKFNGTRYFVKPLLELFRLFDQDQYMVASMEYNTQSIEECCSEFVLVRDR